MNEQQIYWAFATLGLPRNANKEQAKHAYRLLCKQYHPDKNNSNNTIQRYLLVQQAYEMVCYVLDFQKNFQLQQQQLNQPKDFSMYSGSDSQQGFTDKTSTCGSSQSYGNPYYNQHNQSTGRIFGNNEAVKQNYNKMQKRQAETQRLRQWEDTTQRQKKQQKEKKVQELLHSRKLPSQIEQEKWNQLERQKEAERIAGIIQKILELNM